jgi:hypothetical protein
MASVSRLCGSFLKTHRKSLFLQVIVKKFTLKEKKMATKTKAQDKFAPGSTADQDQSRSSQRNS